MEKGLRRKSNLSLCIIYYRATPISGALRFLTMVGTCLVKAIKLFIRPFEIPIQRKEDFVVEDHQKLIIKMV